MVSKHFCHQMEKSGRQKASTGEIVASWQKHVKHISVHEIIMSLMSLVENVTINKTALLVKSLKTASRFTVNIVNIAVLLLTSSLATVFKRSASLVFFYIHVNILQCTSRFVWHAWSKSKWLYM